MFFRPSCAVLLLAIMPAMASAASPAAQTGHARGLYRGQPVTYAQSHGRLIFQGDILLDTVSPLPPDGRSLQPSLGVAYTQ
jgi:hypothetical protein